MSETQGRPPLRVLSLDGGGVKGLSMLITLERIFHEIQRQEGLPEVPRPCDYFDLIGGTSTGGLVAIMLGRLRMTVAECIEVFKNISRIVFGDPQGPVSGFISGMVGKPYFKGIKLANAVRDLLKARGMDEDALLSDSNDASCKVFVCATRAQTVHPVLLRSYPSPTISDRDYTCYIWEAARATSAAPLFFEPITFRHSGATFVDGAMHLNNPISEVVSEAKRLYPRVPFRSIISIGTGWTDVKGLDKMSHKLPDVIHTCVDISLNSTREAQKFLRDFDRKELFNDRKYFRFDVERKLDTIALEEWKKLDEIDALTEAYLGRPDKENDLLYCVRSISDRSDTTC